MRRTLRKAGVGYVLAVPKSHQLHAPFGRIDQAIADAPDEAWERRSCGDGAKGPRTYDWAVARLPVIDVFDGDRPIRQRRVLARRGPARPEEIAYYLAYAPNGTPVAELVRSPGRAGRSRKPSRQRRTNAASTSTKPAAIQAGTGTSPWPCSPTHSWPLSQPKPLKGGPQKRPHQHHPLHRGRSPPTPGRSAALPHTPPRPRRTCPELVPLAQTTPSHSPPLPLPKKNQLRQRFLTGALALPGHRHRHRLPPGSRRGHRRPPANRTGRQRLPPHPPPDWSGDPPLGSRLPVHQREWAVLAPEFGVRLSVGRTGQCWDNALGESFSAILKNLTDRHPSPEQPGRCPHRDIRVDRKLVPLASAAPADYEATLTA